MMTRFVSLLLYRLQVWENVGKTVPRHIVMQEHKKGKHTGVGHMHTGPN